MRQVAALFLLVTLLTAGFAPAHEGRHRIENTRQFIVDLPQHVGNDTVPPLEAASEAGLFGVPALEDQVLDGQFVDAEVGSVPGTLTGVTFQGEPWIERLDLEIVDATRHLDGPVLSFDNGSSGLTLHDNRYGWLQGRALTSAVVLTFPPGTTIEAADDFHYLIKRPGEPQDHLFLHSSYRSDVANATLTLHPYTPDELSFTLTREAGPLASGLEPTLWALVAYRDGALVADMLRESGADHKVLEAGRNQVTLNAVGITSVRNTQDNLIRLDTTGLFEPEATDKFRLIQREVEHTRQQPQDLLDPNDPEARGFSVEAREELTVVQMRLPSGQVTSGPLSLERDVRPPTVENLQRQNLSGTWAPEERPPMFTITTGEPSTVDLVLTHDDEQVVSVSSDRSALSHTFRLSGLQPVTRYQFTATLTDAVGNANTTSGEIRTPPTNQTPARIEIRSPQHDAQFDNGTVEVEVFLWVPGNKTIRWTQYGVFLDRQPITDHVTTDGDRLRVRLTDLPEGSHELAVKAMAPDGEVVQRAHSFQVGQTPAHMSTPFVAMLVVGVLLLGFVVYRVYG